MITIISYMVKTYNGNMANARRKGIRVEQIKAKQIREAGFEDCITSREGSKLHDDAGVDFMNIPAWLQCKAGYARGINYTELLADLQNKTKKLKEKKPIAILHVKDVGKGRKRRDVDDVVIMTFEDYLKLLYGYDKSL